MNTLLLTVIFFVNFLSVSNDSNSDYDILIDSSKKYNTISYDKIAVDTQFKLNKLMRLLSKNQSQMVLTIESLLQLIDHEIITARQSELIWSYLSHKSQKPEEISQEKNSKISIKKKEDEIHQKLHENSSQNEEKRAFSFYQLMFLILIGYIIVVFFIVIIFVALYQRETFVLLCFLSVFLCYNFLNYSQILIEQKNAEFLPAIFLNSSFFFTNFVIHLIFLKLKLQKKFLKLTDVFLIDEAFKGKILQAFISVFLSYNLAFSCKSGFIHAPFYITIYYTVYLLSSRFEGYFFKRLWPSWLFTLSLLSFILMCYLYKFGSKSFIFFENRGEFTPDFQFMGYFFSVLTVNTFFPVYLYIQHKKLWQIYKSNEFSYKLVFKNFREEISQDVLIFDFSMVYYHIYAAVLMGIIFLGLKIKMVIMVVIPSFALQSYMGFIVKDDRFFWMIFFYIGSIYVLNSVFLLGKMEDKMAISVNFFIIY